MRILVVDDMPSVHKFLALVFEKLGHEMVSAYSAEEAIRLLPASRPDCVFLDLILPNMDGRELCFRIKNQAEFRDIPVVIITVRSEEQDRRICEFAGADFFLAKPLKPEDVIEALKRIP